jgi:tRNA-(ms[2]io[6]A)-hydroxylase
LAEVLLDHAHCEKKAASTALALLFRYQHLTDLVRPLSEIAREELEHFEQCLTVLNEYDVAFVRQKQSPYAARLRAACRDTEPERLLDTLLCCALIEARSCERMKLLADELDEPLATFYRELLASEARHFTTYLAMARRHFDHEVVDERLEELSAHEAQVISQPPHLPRLHAGWGA